MYASINLGDGTTSTPPNFRSLGKVRDATAGKGRSYVRLGDIDGDGRVDYCLHDDNGDLNCWRNGGFGKSRSPGSRRCRLLKYMKLTSCA